MAVMLVLGCWTGVLPLLCSVFFPIFLFLLVSVLPVFSVSIYVFYPFLFQHCFSPSLFSPPRFGCGVGGAGGGVALG